MRHIVKITAKPVLSGKQSIPDGAVSGNGDLGLILGNSENGMRIYISKCDIWQGIERYDRGGLKPLGYIDIAVPAEIYDDYYAEQDMDMGELRCMFGKDGKNCTVSVRACKIENSVMLEIGGSIEAEPVLRVFGGETSGEKGEYGENGCQVIFRSFAGDDHEFETHAFAAMKKVSDGKYYIFAATNHDVENPKQAALEKAECITDTDYETLRKEHYEAWKSFWSKSSFSVDNEELETGWYSSQYFLACCAGNKNFAPGIYANFITVENPNWHSDYHLNYNYQAPFYAACSSNHVELTDCYHAPLEEFTKKGRSFASRFNCRGILYPVGIMPKGLCSELNPKMKYSFERLFLGQKSNAVHPADIMVFRWKATRDREYAEKHAYPYIKAALEFFEDWAKLKNGRYSVCDDAAHEVPIYKPNFDPKKFRYRYLHDKNNALTLGLLRLCIPAAIDMAKEFGVDADKQEKWQQMLDCLPPFPTYYRFFRRVFRYTEKGQRWNDGGDVGLQHIYPCGSVGLLISDRKTVKIAKNTFRMKERYCWTDDNAVSSFFPMAARLGRDPKVITQKLHELNRKKMLPNMLYNFGGGCLENCSIFACTLNEMVLQSFEGTIRIFPCWDRNTDVRYENLRADGAFLVSSEIKNGKISYVRIESEKGGKVRIENPYKTAVLEIDGKALKTEEKFITLDVQKNDVITIRTA